MKKRISIIVFIAIIGIIGVFIYNNDSGRSTDVRAKHMTVELEDLGFEESIATADIIAEVKIESIIEEIDEPSAKTIFAAQSSKVYKNDADKLKAINIMQQGNSQWIFNNNEQFKTNEKIILFLKKAVGYEDTYWIIGEELNYYKFITVDNEEYIAKWSKQEKVLSKIEKKSVKEKFELKFKNEKSNDYKLKDTQLFLKQDFEKILMQYIENKK